MTQAESPRGRQGGEEGGGGLYHISDNIWVSEYFGVAYWLTTTIVRYRLAARKRSIRRSNRSVTICSLKGTSNIWPAADSNRR